MPKYLLLNDAVQGVSAGRIKRAVVHRFDDEVYRYVVEFKSKRKSIGFLASSGKPDEVRVFKSIDGAVSYIQIVGLTTVTVVLDSG